MEKRVVNLDKELDVPLCYAKYFQTKKQKPKEEEEEKDEKEKENENGIEIPTIVIQFTKEKNKDLTVATFPKSIKLPPKELNGFTKLLKKKYGAGASYKENPLKISLSGNRTEELKEELEDNFDLGLVKFVIIQKKLKAPKDFKVSITPHEQSLEVTWIQKGSPRDLEIIFENDIEKELGGTYINNSTKKEGKFIIKGVTKEAVYGYFTDKYSMEYNQIEESSVYSTKEPKYNNEIEIDIKNQLSIIESRFNNPKNQYFFEMSQAILKLCSAEKIRYQKMSFNDNLKFTRKGVDKNGKLTKWTTVINPKKILSINRLISGHALNGSDKVFVKYLGRDEIQGTITDIDPETGLITAKFLLKSDKIPPGYKEELDGSDHFDEDNEFDYDQSENEEEDENQNKIEKSLYENFLKSNKIEQDEVKEEEETEEEDKIDQEKEEQIINEIIKKNEGLLKDEEEDEVDNSQINNDSPYTIHFEKSDAFYQKCATSLCCLRDWNSEVKRIIIDIHYDGNNNENMKLSNEEAYVNLKESTYLTPEEKKNEKLMQKLEIKPTLEQKKALEMILSNKVSVVHGGPGTGKTFSLGLFVYHLLTRAKDDEKHRILLCAKNNQAVGQMVKFVSPIVHALGKKIVWVSYQNFENRKEFIEATDEEKTLISYQIMRRNTNEAKKYQSLQNEKWNYNDIVNRTKKNRSGEIPKFPSNNLKEMNDLKMIIETNIIHEADVVCCAISTTAKKSVINLKFQTIFIDEAQQSTEIYSIIPLIHQPEKLVLLGDNKQLHSYANYKIKKSHPIPFRSLYKKLMKKKVPMQSLNVQFRMNPAILEFPNAEFYKERIRISSKVEENTKVDLQFIKTPKPNIIFIDVPNGKEKKLKDGTFINKSECIEVQKIVINLKVYQIQGKEVGVITPYFSQSQKLDQLLSLLKYKGLKVSTIENFQGEERDFIIFSLVRASEVNEKLIFPPDKNQLNVALTRARKGLIIVGKLDLFSNDSHNKNEFLLDLCDFYKQKNSIVQNDKIELLKHSIQKRVTKKLDIKMKSKKDDDQNNDDFDDPNPQPTGKIDDIDNFIEGGGDDIGNEDDFQYDYDDDYDLNENYIPDDDYDE